MPGDEVNRPAVGKEEKRLQAFFRINATARGGAREARLRASLDSRQPEGDPLDTPVEFTRRVENTNETDVPSVWEVDFG